VEAGVVEAGAGVCLQLVRVRAERIRRAGVRRVTMLLWMLGREKQILRCAKDDNSMGDARAEKQTFRCANGG
jgi:hypothetical protein